MRKSTIFISAVFTTFALVMLYRVVSIYQSMSNLPEATACRPIRSPRNLTSYSAPTATQLLSALEAAQLAAQVVGNPNLSAPKAQVSMA